MYFQEADLKEAFKIFDRDKDGFIDMKELKKVIFSSERIKDYRTWEFKEYKGLQNSRFQRG